MTTDPASTRIRPATVADAAAISAIYAPYVRETTVSLELEPPDVEEMGRRIEALIPAYPYLVLEQHDDVRGYAYASPHRVRAAYRSSTEVSVYVDRSHHRRGFGRQLYLALFDALRDTPYHLALAGITLPNDASEALHRSLGFEPVGIYREVGHKFGRFIDTVWMQRRIRLG